MLERCAGVVEIWVGQVEAVVATTVDLEDPAGVREDSTGRWVEGEACVEVEFPKEEGGEGQRVVASNNSNNS